MFRLRNSSGRQAAAVIRISSDFQQLIDKMGLTSPDELPKSGKFEFTASIEQHADWIHTLFYLSSQSPNPNDQATQHARRTMSFIPILSNLYGRHDLDYKWLGDETLEDMINANKLGNPRDRLKGLQIAALFHNSPLVNDDADSALDCAILCYYYLTEIVNLDRNMARTFAMTIANKYKNAYNSPATIKADAHVKNKLAKLLHDANYLNAIGTRQFDIEQLHFYQDVAKNQVDPRNELFIVLNEVHGFLFRQRQLQTIDIDDILADLTGYSTLWGLYRGSFTVKGCNKPLIERNSLKARLYKELVFAKEIEYPTSLAAKALAEGSRQTAVESVLSKLGNAQSEQSMAESQASLLTPYMDVHSGVGFMIDESPENCVHWSSNAKKAAASFSKVQQDSLSKKLQGKECCSSSTKVLRNITKYDYIYYSLDPSHLKTRSFGHELPVIQPVRIIQARYLQDVYRIKYDRTLSIFEYSSLHGSIKPRRFSDAEILAQWQDLIAHYFAKELSRQGGPKPIDSENDDIKIAALYYNQLLLDDHIPADVHYSDAMRDQINQFIDQAREKYNADRVVKTQEAINEGACDITNQPWLDIILKHPERFIDYEKQIQEKFDALLTELDNPKYVLDTARVLSGGIYDYSVTEAQISQNDFFKKYKIQQIHRLAMALGYSSIIEKCQAQHRAFSETVLRKLIDEVEIVSRFSQAPNRLDLRQYLSVVAFFAMCSLEFSMELDGALLSSALEKVSTYLNRLSRTETFNKELAMSVELLALAKIDYVSVLGSAIDRLEKSINGDLSRLDVGEITSMLFAAEKIGLLDPQQYKSKAEAWVKCSDAIIGVNTDRHNRLERLFFDRGVFDNPDNLVAFLNRVDIECGARYLIEGVESGELMLEFYPLISMLNLALQRYQTLPDIVIKAIHQRIEKAILDLPSDESRGPKLLSVANVIDEIQHHQLGETGFKLTKLFHGTALKLIPEYKHFGRPLTTKSTDSPDEYIEISELQFYWKQLIKPALHELRSEKQIIKTLTNILKTVSDNVLDQAVQLCTKYVTDNLKDKSLYEILVILFDDNDLSKSRIASILNNQSLRNALSDDEWSDLYKSQESHAWHTFMTTENLHWQTNFLLRQINDIILPAERACYQDMLSKYEVVMSIRDKISLKGDAIYYDGQPLDMNRLNVEIVKASYESTVRPEDRRFIPFEYYQEAIQAFIPYEYLSSYAKDRAHSLTHDEVIELIAIRQTCKDDEIYMNSKDLETFSRLQEDHPNSGYDQLLNCLALINNGMKEKEAVRKVFPASVPESKPKGFSPFLFFKNALSADKAKQEQNSMGHNPRV